MRDTRVNADLTADAVKLAPTGTVGVLTMFGIPLEQWVYILTIIYTTLLIVWFVFAKTRELLRKPSAATPPEPD